MISRASTRRRSPPTSARPWRPRSVAYASGEDYREVVVDRAMKSLGHDQTFARSLVGDSEVARALKVHAAVVARALRDRATRGAHDQRDRALR